MECKALYQLNLMFKADKDTKVGDVVYFRKEEASAFKGAWTVGCVEEIERGRDGLVREAVVRYVNASEQTPRYTKEAYHSNMNDMKLNRDNSCRPVGPTSRAVYPYIRHPA